MKLFLLTLLSLSALVQSGVVCTGEELQKIMNDNESFSLFGSNEINCKKEKWTGDCGFQTSGPALQYWLDAIYYGLPERNIIYKDEYRRFITNQDEKELYFDNESHRKEIGEILEKEAHLCVFLRTILIKKKDFAKWTSTAINDIACAGDPKDRSKQICAANPNSINDTEKWAIFINRTGMRLNNKPEIKKI